jgi:hypothetical protein
MKTRNLVIGIGTFALATTACGSGEDPIGQVSSALSDAGPTCASDWTVADSPNAETGDNALASVAGSSAADVWAVGQFAPDANPNITQTLAIHFDGTAWSLADTPNIGTHANALLAVTAQPGRAWAVGYHIGAAWLSESLIEAWDGTSWTVVKHPQPFDTENLYGATSTSQSDVWAVGSGRDGEGVFHTIALHFNGHTWSVVPTVDPGVNGNVLYGVVAVAPNDVWAAGQKIGAGGPDQALVEHWDGFRWSEVPAATVRSASTQLLAISATHGGVSAAGDAQDGMVSLRTLGETAEHRLFSRAVTANPSTGDNRFAGVVLVGDETWAVGNFLDPTSGNQLTLIERGGEGSPWTEVSSPNPSSDGDNQLANVTRTGARDLWAVGSFDGPDRAQTLVLHRCMP